MLVAEVGGEVGGSGEEAEEVFVLEEGVEAAETEAEEDAGGEGAAALAGHKDVGAGGALGVGEGAVLFDDELAAEGDHEEDAKPSAEEGEGEDAGGFEVEAEEDECGEGEDDSGGDGLASVSGGLDDVVFEDAGAAEGAEDGDGEDGDGDAGSYGKACAKTDIDGDGTEEDSEDGAEEEGADGELGARFGRWHKGLEAGGCCHIDISAAKNCGWWLRRSVTAGVRRSTMHLVWCRIVDGGPCGRAYTAGNGMRFACAASEVSLQRMLE